MKRMKNIIYLVSVSLFIFGCSGSTVDKYMEARSRIANPPVPDTTPPMITSAKALSRTEIEVTFSEEVDEESAEKIANYYIQGPNRIEITGATLDGSANKAVISVSGAVAANRMLTGQDYTILAQNVMDVKENAATYTTAAFTGLGWVVAEFSEAIPAASNSTSMNITVAGTDVLAYQYSLDGSAWTTQRPVSQQIALAGLTEGFHTLKVVGLDSKGEWQDINTSTNATWLVDITPPETAMKNLPASVTDVDAAEITVTSNDAVAYKYQLNSTGWSEEFPISQKITFKELQDGEYVLEVIGKDIAGNWQAEAGATAYTWVVSTASDMAVLYNTPARYTRSTSADIQVGGTAIYSYRYALDGDAYGDRTNLGNYIELRNLPEGNHTIKVVGINVLEQEQLIPTTYTWTVDRTAPIALLNNAPATPTNDTRLNVQVYGDGIVQYKYRVNGGAWYTSVISSSINLTGFSQGTHTLEVSGIDAAGNVQTDQGLPTTHTWTVDLSAPTVVLNGTPASLENTKNVSIDVVGAGVVAFKYRLDGGTWSQETAVDALNPDIVLTGLAEGSHIIYVIGRDAAGNWQSIVAPTTCSWSIDVTAPVAELFNTPNVFTNNNSIGVDVGGAGVTVYKYKLDGDVSWSEEKSVADPIPHITASGLVDGPHSLKVVARDEAGNWQADGSATTISWTIDPNTPEAVLSNTPTTESGADKLTQGKTISINVGGTDIVSYMYKIDLEGWSGTISTSVPINRTLTDGTHIVYVRGLNTGGIWQEVGSATTWTWTIDSTPPTVVLNDLPNNPTNQDSISVSVNGDGVVSYKYELDGKGYGLEKAASEKISEVELDETPHTLNVVGKDAAGNWQSTPTTYAWTIDKSVAIAELKIDPATSPTNSRSVRITVGPQSLVAYKYLFKDPKVADPVWSGEQNIGSILELSSLGDNSYEVQVVGKDVFGNWQEYTSATSVSWTVDTSRPTATLSNLPNSITMSKTTDIIVGGTGVVAYKYRIDGNTWSAEVSNSPTVTHIALTGLSDGFHTIYVIGKDSAGNWQAVTGATNYTWLIDSSAPTAVLSNRPQATTSINSTSIIVGGAGVVAYKYGISDTEPVWSGITESDVSDPIVETGLAVDHYKLWVIARDSLGNWQTTLTTYEWDVISIQSPPTFDTGDHEPSLNLKFTWTNPVGTQAVKIQIATKNGTGADSFDKNIVFGVGDGYQLGGVTDYFDYNVDPEKGTTYYARVKVAGPGVDDWAASFGTPSDGIEIVGSISGMVRIYNGAAVSGATVRLYRMTDDVEIATPLEEVQTNPSGLFYFNAVAVGSNYYKIVVRVGTSPNYRYATKNNITVEPGQETNVGVIYIAPAGAVAGTLYGTIVDANVGSIIGYAHVSVIDWKGDELASMDSLPGDGSFTTGAITVPGGTYSVVISLPGYYDLVVDNQVVNNNTNMGNQAICELLSEPQVRVVLLWGSNPSDLDLHVVGPTNQTVTTGGIPYNRFYVWWADTDALSFNESTGQYIDVPDPSGTFSTTSLVIDDVGSYGPEAINLFRYGGAQYAQGVYTYTVHNYSGGGWSASTNQATIRIYDSMGMVREIPMPYRSDMDSYRYWLAFKLNIAGMTRSQRTVFVNSVSPFGTLTYGTKSSMDW